MISPLARQRRVALHFPALAAPSFVHADRTRLKQVMINLLSNAIKYNRDDGAVTVSCGAGPKGTVRVSIADTGAGLSPAQLGQLFQAFNRLGQEGREQEGTGIGLVVSKRLIELMGGAIGVDSVVGRGSVFWFELAAIDAPTLSEDRSHVTAPAQVSQAVKLRTVLYVEDNPANRALVAQIITRVPGVRLLTAVDGLAGIELARSARPDVILMDINLPGISGIEAMNILRADPATARIPVLALSANALPRDVARGLEAGFFGYITKPIKVKDFIHSLTVALDAPVRPAA
jgi:CheY-like chemotaxis protein